MSVNADKFFHDAIPKPSPSLWLNPPLRSLDGALGNVIFAGRCPRVNWGVLWGRHFSKIGAGKRSLGDRIALVLKLDSTNQLPDQDSQFSDLTGSAPAAHRKVSGFCLSGDKPLVHWLDTIPELSADRGFSAAS